MISTALAALIPEDQLSCENIIPEALDLWVIPAVEKKEADAVRLTGVARICGSTPYSEGQ